jgi:hypothetical protein
MRRAATSTEAFTAAVERGAPDAREPCGDLDEALWGEANPELETMLAMIGRSVADQRELEGTMFRGLSCRSVDDTEFGMMLHIAALAPAWVDRDFLECATRRESAHEGFPLWTLLDITRDIPGSRTWVDPASFSDERTLRRLSATSPTALTRPLESR